MILLHTLAKILLPAIGLGVGVLALSLQAWLFIPFATASGMSLGGAIVNYVSYFTILGNALVVVCYVALLVPSAKPLARFARHPQTLAAVVIYCVTTELNYALFLQASWEPVGLWRLADVLLHYIAPNLFILYWLIAVPRGQTYIRNVRAWLLFPLAYVAFILARGALTGLYPYRFLDVRMEGPGTVLRNVAILMGVFICESIILVCFDRWRAGRLSQAQEKAP